MNHPTILNRQSDGINVSQLRSDFGKTLNLTEAAIFRRSAAKIFRWERSAINAKIIVRRLDGQWLLSRRDGTIVAWHEVPGIRRKIVPSQRDD